MKRLLHVLGVVAVIGIASLFVFIGANTMWWWIEVHTGTVNESGPYYGFWSGFGSDIGEYAIIVTLMTGLYHNYKRHNCEVHKCWRIGRHDTAAGHTVCKHCHKKIVGHDMTLEHITNAHNAALENNVRGN